MDQHTAAATAAELRRAAEEAGRAPSILNTQPWRWRLRHDTLELHADTARQLDAVDPQGRLLTLSCGAALHHARVALAAAGFEPVVDRRPDPEHPSLLARVRADRRRPAGPEELVTYQALLRRHTDRRPFSARVPVAAEQLAALRAAAEAEHAHLHRLGAGDVRFLRYAAQGAQAIDAKDERRAGEQHAWTHRGASSGDGVPSGTVATGAVTRPVPMRDFGLDDEATLEPGAGDDRHAEYLVVVTDADRPADWLTAGEAASAAWLAAAARGLAASPMSDVVEVPGARAVLAGLVDPPGHPQLVLRVGVCADPEPPPASPRRRPGDTIGT